MPGPLNKPPLTVEETGIRRKFLEDLALKTVYLMGEMSLRDLADHLRIKQSVVDELFHRLRKEQLWQVTGMSGTAHRIVTTSDGKARAMELLLQSQYIGPAPVTLDAYVQRVRSQTIQRLDVDQEQLTRSFDHLVLPQEVLTQLGTAVVSGRSIFLYGPSGTGKTTVAENLWRLIADDAIWLPYAVEADGQVIVVYDPAVHHRVAAPETGDVDERWVLCQRPCMLVGGELTIEMLDLQYNPATRYYAAPVQMKANNGLLIVDDFGRQRVQPHELLNRWVVPLDRGIDFLSLAGGRKIEIPFDMLVVFATNLDPVTLVDEALLRRIQTKIKLDIISEAEFHEIFRRVSTEVRLEYHPSVVDNLVTLITRDLRQDLRACQPRDIIQHVCWTARYQKTEPRLDDESVRIAARAYFLAPPV
jgi:predicted ATPase with chaperone activity